MRPVNRLIAIGLLPLLAVASPASAQSVTSVSCDNGLSFGSLAAGAASSTVKIDAASGSRSRLTGDVFLITSGAGAAGGRATCTVVVSGAASYSISFSASTISLTKSGGGSMSLALATSPVSTLTTTGTSGTFYVGGTLTVSASQSAGNYSGTYTVTVQYP